MDMVLRWRMFCRVTRQIPQIRSQASYELSTLWNLLKSLRFLYFKKLVQNLLWNASNYKMDGCVGRWRAV